MSLGHDVRHAIRLGARDHRVTWAVVAALSIAIAVINSRLAHNPDSNLPISITIVGIAPDIRQRATRDRPTDPVVYVPYESDPLPFTTLIVTSPRAVADVAVVMRRFVAELDPSLPVFN